jgi:hypothetical protein
MINKKHKILLRTTNNYWERKALIKTEWYNEKTINDPNYFTFLT